mmetsp:Transcript_19632/g.35020  ORF Transcript_19632/g.35020 Transcript_19632/m.35020 type:complete len:299 (+) Transcript_19632:59-955(+)
MVRHRSHIGIATTLTSLALAPPGAIGFIGTKGCTLVEDSFDLMIQGVLGLLAFMTLILKREVETPKRPFKIWFFDAAKQGFVGMMLHCLNIAIAEFMSRENSSEFKSDECDFYFVNFVIDTAVGVVLTFFLLECVKIFAETFNYPRLKSGEYGDPPLMSTFLIQLGVFVAITLVIKVLLFLIEMSLRNHLDYIGYNLFQSADNYPKTKLIIVMVAAPLVLNAVQFWLVDYILKGDTVSHSAIGTPTASLSKIEEAAPDIFPANSDVIGVCSVTSRSENGSVDAIASPGHARHDVVEAR